MRRFPSIGRLAGIAIAAVSLAACQPQAQAPAAAPAAPDYAAELGPEVNTLFEVWNSQDYAKLDGVLSPDYIRRAPDQNADGLEAMVSFMKQVHVTYPDFHITDNTNAFGKDLAFTQWTVTGTYTAEGAEPVKVEISGATLLRFANGLVTEEHVYYDTAALDRLTGTKEPPHVGSN